MNKRKVLYIVLCVMISFAMLVTLFTGCSDNEKQGDINTDETASQSKVEEKKEAEEKKEEPKEDAETPYNGELPVTDEKVTFTYALPEGVAAVTAVPSNDLPIIQKYEEMTNVHIEWEPIPSSSYSEVITARLSAGVELPDLVSVPGSICSRIGSEGTIIDLTDLINNNAPRMLEFLSDKVLERIKHIAPDGKIYNIDGYVLPDMYNIGIMINKFWLENTGLDYPETIDEFYNMLVAFRDQDPNGNGKKDEIPLTCMPDRPAYLSNSFGLQLTSGGAGANYQVDENGKVTCDFIDPRYKEYLAFLNKLYSEGLLDKEYMTLKQEGIFEKVKNDTVGTIIDWHSWPPRHSSMHPKGDPTGETPVFIPTAPLEGPRGDRYMVKRIPGGGGGGVSITKDCKHPDIAVRWLDFIIYSKEAHDMYVYGLEGITYKVENGEKVKIQPDKGTWEEKLISIGGRQPAHPYVQTVEARKAIFPEWIYPYSEEFKKYYVDPFPGHYVALTLEEQRIWNQINPDINTYVNEATAKFITGQESLDKFDEYVNTLKNIGLDQIIEIQQARYDRFLEMQKN